MDLDAMEQVCASVVLAFQDISGQMVCTVQRNHANKNIWKHWNLFFLLFPIGQLKFELINLDQ